MASVSDLVKVVAIAEELEENFVSVYARSAREAGMISHFGRGKNAAKMTSRDAANLLIAVNASDLAKNVPKTIDKFRQLKIGLTSIREIVGDHSLHSVFQKASLFGEALEKIVELCIDSKIYGDRLGEAMFDGLGFPKGGISRRDLISSIDETITLKISFLQPVPFVIVSFRDARNTEVGGALFGDRAGVNRVERLVSTTITQKTLRSVGSALST